MSLLAQVADAVAPVWVDIRQAAVRCVDTCVRTHPPARAGSGFAAFDEAGAPVELRSWRLFYLGDVCFSVASHLVGFGRRITARGPCKLRRRRLPESSEAANSSDEEG